MTINPTTDLRAERVAAAVNRKKMAEALGWSQFRLDRFELGDREATAADVAAWKAALRKLTAPPAKAKAAQPAKRTTTAKSK